MEVTNRKARVTSANINMIRDGVPVPDQRRAIKIGDLVTTAWTEDNGFITVFHTEGVAMLWRNVGPIGMPDTPPSQKGSWIDATEMIVFDDGSVCGLDGKAIR